MARIFNLSFLNLFGASNRFNIGSTGTNKSVVGAKKPVNIKEDNNKDLLSPIRVKTGYINIINEYGDDISDIFPTTQTSHPVSSVSFLGYLQAQNFDTPVKNMSYELKLPIVSPLKLYLSKTYPSLAPQSEYRLREVFYNILDITGYERLIFPKGEEDAEGSGIVLDNIINTLSICPYSTNNDYNYTSQNIMEPHTIKEILEGICHYYGLIVHDHVYAGMRTLLITKPDYDGLYQMWNLDHLNGEGNPWDESVLGNAVRNFNDYFEVMSDNETDSRILPYGKITFNYEANSYLDVKIHPERSRYISNVFKGNFVHCMLEPVGGWLTSQFLSTSSLSGTVSLCGIYNNQESSESGATEYIHTNLGGAQDTEMFRLVMAEARPHWYKVTGDIKIWQNLKYENPAGTDGGFGIAVYYGGFYWDWNENVQAWSRTPNQKILSVTPTNGTFSTPGINNPLDEISEASIPSNSTYQIIFYIDINQTISHKEQIFKNITLVAWSSSNESKYRNDSGEKSYINTLGLESIENAEVNQMFSPDMYDVKYINGVNGGYFSKMNYTYLLYDSIIRKIDVKISSILISYENYLCKWNFGDSYTWRLLAYDDNVRDGIRTLTFFGNKNL